MRSNESPKQQLIEIPLGTGFLTFVHPARVPADYKHIEKGWFQGYGTVRSAHTHGRITTVVLNERINPHNHGALLDFCNHRIAEGDSVSFSENPDLEESIPALTEIRNAIEVYVSRVS